MPSIIIDKSKPELVEVELPSYPGSVVKMLRRLPLDVSRNVAKKYPKAQERDIEQGYQSSVELLSIAVKDWNLAQMVKDEQGKEVEQKIEITADNIGTLLSDEDVMLLGAILRGKARQKEGVHWELISEEEKKS